MLENNINLVQIKQISKRKTKFETKSHTAELHQYEITFVEIEFHITRLYVIYNVDFTHLEENSSIWKSIIEILILFRSNQFD